MIRKGLLIRAVVFIPLLAAMAAGQQAPMPERSPESQTAVSPTPSPSENTVIDNLQNALKEREDKQQQEVLADPTRPRTHRFTDQPIGTVLRALAEEAEINYIEPGINPEERISVVLPNMTPIQAFYAIAGAGGLGS